MVRKVAVIGGGVIGITTAVVIAEHLDNVQVTVISDKWSPDTTGDGSAGYWAPYLLGDLPPDTLREWCKKSSEIFQEIFQSAKAVEYGVGLLPVYCIFSYAPTDDSVFNDLYLDYRPMTKKELSVFPSKYCYGISITSFFAECTKLLPALMKRIEKRDGRFIEKKIYSFSELAGKYDVVINCTGIGARNLVPDPEVTPIRGQVIKVRAPWMKHCVIIDDDYYVIPNSEEDAKILRDWVGLRPYRSTPRVERESIKTKKGNIDVIHNYGHGGSGVTVSWGCAFEVLGLLREALEDPYSSGFRSKM
ncbi:D-aspartate oxidase like protein [Argiope bruennichi]|uniref:D-aspartate oxidase like protein n=1 Tax=Argiope bruennichi TaxID=94029 RepID=A0A8T0E769_ARGBR|nr:D-aspartate oxidase like protein [Argiope bruennichi]